MTASTRADVESLHEAYPRADTGARRTARGVHAKICPVRRLLALAAVAIMIIAPLAAGAAETPDTSDLWGGKRTFTARLSADYQPVVTKSNGQGAARIVLDIATRTISWEIEYSGLTSPATAIGLHGPAQPGTNGAVIIDLGPKALKSPVSGSLVVPQGQIQYMLLGWTYVLVSTRRYPNGELRGKLDVVPPEKAGFERP